MTKQTEALKLALEAITTYLSESPDPSEEAVEGLCDARALIAKALAEQPAQQCWKCGDMDSSFQAKCSVPACGIKEQPAPVAWLPPAPPPECKSEAEKTAFAFGWFKALEAQRALDKKAENARELGLDYEPTQPHQEPVAWMVYTLDGKSVCVTDNPTDFTPEHKALPLYTSPPAQRKPLTAEEIIKCWGQASWTRHGYVAFARAIEAAHGIKGNA